MKIWIDGSLTNGGNLGCWTQVSRTPKNVLSVMKCEIMIDMWNMLI